MKFTKTEKFCGHSFINKCFSIFIKDLNSKGKSNSAEVQVVAKSIHVADKYSIKQWLMKNEKSENCGYLSGYLAML